MRRFVVASFVIIACWSCKKSPPKEVAVSVDSLINNWNHAWNRGDSTALRKMFDRNPVVVEDDYVARDFQAISKIWIRNQILQTRNLKCTQLQGWASSDKAGYLGTYTLDRMAGKGTPYQQSGVVSMSWKKIPEGKWKITNVHLHTFHETNPRP